MRCCLLLSAGVVGPGPVALLWTDPLLGAPGKIKNHLEKISTAQTGNKIWQLFKNYQYQVGIT